MFVAAARARSLNKYLLWLWGGNSNKVIIWEGDIRESHGGNDWDDCRIRPQNDRPRFTDKFSGKGTEAIIVGMWNYFFNPLSSSLEVFQTGEDCIAYDGEKMLRLIQSGAATCKKGVLLCFLKITLACLGCMAAAVQPKRLGNSQKTFYKRSSTSCRPRL